MGIQGSPPVTATSVNDSGMCTSSLRISSRYPTTWDTVPPRASTTVVTPANMIHTVQGSLRAARAFHRTPPHHCKLTASYLVPTGHGFTTVSINRTPSLTSPPYSHLVEALLMRFPAHTGRRSKCQAPEQSRVQGCKCGPVYPSCRIEPHIL